MYPFALRGEYVEPIQFEELEHMLTSAGALVGAAECHGNLCGILCGGRTPESSRWVEHTLGAQPAGETPECEAELEQLSHQMRRILDHEELSFEPLLPAGNSRLEHRVEALAQWCQGFLAGLGEARVSQLEELPDDSREVIRDMVEITRAGLEVDGHGDEQEAAYAEIVEYVRVGVLLLLEDLNPLSPTQPVVDPGAQLH